MEPRVHRQIVVVDYNPSWPTEFEEEQIRIRSSVPWIRAIEHAGSTSVPGLAAKPIIDMLAAVEDLADAESGQENLKALGYELVPDPTLPERRYFRRLSGVVHSHHLHVYAWAGFSERQEILFRDYLRRHPETASEYGVLKRRLAADDPRPAVYTAAKTDFVRNILARALQERGRVAGYELLERAAIALARRQDQLPIRRSVLQAQPQPRSLGSSREQWRGYPLQPTFTQVATASAMLR
ncbi:MAG: GrpB family protein [Chloroflexi bacterium]|nr:GrpB family protein [Chloroflexota bacterium]